MKLTCPYCNARVGVDPSKIPDRGIQAVCPGCGQKMFIDREFHTHTIKSEDVKRDEQSGLAKAVQRPGNIESSPKIDKIKLKKPDIKKPDFVTGAKDRSDEEPPPPERRYFDEDDDDAVPISEEGYYSWWIKIILSIMIIVTFSLVVIYSRPDQTTRDFSSDFYRGFEDDVSLIQGRLRNRFQMSSSHRLYSVEAGSPECRALTGMMKKCDFACMEVIKAEIFPFNEEGGFRAVTECGDGVRNEVIYRWSTADITINGQPCPKDE